MDSIKDVIIPHFINYPLKSAKSIDFKLWIQCVNSKTAVNILSLKNLEEILSIKGALNLGLSNNLKHTFPHVKIISRPEFKTSEDKLDPYWVTGFTAGDGSFGFSIGKSSHASYEIGLHKREEPLLIKIMEFFDNRGFVKSYKAQTSARYRITKISDLNTLIMPHFDKYKLSGVKHLNYLIWKEMVELMTNKLHLTDEGLAQLKLFKLTLNRN